MIIFLRTFLNIFIQFAKDKVVAQMAREVTLAIYKIIGWVALDLMIYQGNSLFSRRKKRETPSKYF